MRALVAALAIAALGASGCFDSALSGLKDGKAGCRLPDHPCPNGFHCAADNTCWRDGRDPDLGGGCLAGGCADLSTDLATNPSIDGPMGDSAPTTDLASDGDGATAPDAAETADLALVVAPDLAMTASPDLAMTVSPDLAMTVSPDLAMTVSPDLAMMVPPDLSVTVPRDLSVTVPPDLSVTVPPDLSVTVPPDLSVTVPPDLSVTIPPDLTTPADLSVPPDLTVIRDLTVPPDLVKPPDLVVVDLAGANCGAAGQSCCTGGLCASGACCLAGQCTAVNTLTDALNCGACGVVCSASHVTPLCSSGVCSGSCSSGWADCNGNKQSDGCEVNVANDPDNCGTGGGVGRGTTAGCGVICSGNHVTTRTCSSGVCTSQCAGGFDDCNSNKLVDGCETALLDSPVNCNACGRTCSTNHIPTPTCTSGVCTGTCDVNWADCNGNKLTDGCETEIDLPTSCGGCGLVCSSLNMASITCGLNLAGTKNICNGACKAGYADCNGNKQPDGCEANIYGDPLNCGACGQKCSTNNMYTVLCGTYLGVPGKCTGQCNTGYSDCNGDKLTDGCEANITSNVLNCGGCGMACSTQNITASCFNSSCELGVCASGFGDCNGNKRLDGCEVNTKTDANNCGGCGSGFICSSLNMATRTCGNGVCNGTCASGYADCDGNKLMDGCEINTNNDKNNCGGCGAACSTNNIIPACTLGACTGTCNPGFLDCNGNKRIDGCEVNGYANSSADINNCGTCGVVCSASNMATVTCGPNGSATGGVCDGACATGYADCNGNKQPDGCEKNIYTDATNCGGCAQACSTNNILRACATGSCDAGTCYPGWTNCDGSKRQNGCNCDLATSACGGTGTQCLLLPGQSCSLNAQCLQGACCGVTCGDLLNDAYNCGSCGTKCGASNAGHICTGGKCGCSTGSDCNINTADGCTNGACSCGGNPACNASNQVCTGGSCKLLAGQSCTTNAQCLSNACCNTVCKDTTNDTINCGGCGISCAANNTGHVCLGGSCGCNSLSDCDATLSDNCSGGVCKCGTGAPCGGGLHCISGSCG